MKIIPLIKPKMPCQKTAHLYLRESIKSGMLTNDGPCVQELARVMTQMAYGHAVMTSNGTAAIEVALLAHGLLPGCRVGVPDFTHAGTLLAVVKAGLQPVLMGVDPVTWVLRPEEVIAAAEKGEIQAAIVVSPFGYHVDFARWERLSVQEDLRLVYDLAGGYGKFEETENPRTYSFHATKNFGVGEGGMAVFNRKSERAAIRARRLINFDTLPTRDIQSDTGTNGKMCELVAANLLAGVHSEFHAAVHKRIAHKRSLLQGYAARLKGVYVPPGPKHPSLCVVGGLPARDIETNCENMGFVAKRYYPLLSRMEGLRDVDRFSVSDDAMEHCVALPSDVGPGDFARVVRRLKAFLNA